MNTYAILSIGNGLVTTVPAFLMSTSMGMIVSRAASDSNLGDDMAKSDHRQTGRTETFSRFYGRCCPLWGFVGLIAFPPLPVS